MSASLVGDVWRLPEPSGRSSRAGPLTLHAVGLALCLPAAALSHGYLDDARTERPSTRPLVVDRAPPEAVWSRVSRSKSLRRMGQLRIPGVELWRDCKQLGCSGVTIAVDDRGRVLDTPAVMARLRDRSPLEQARMRYELMARHWRDEVLDARRCGPRVWARVRRGAGARTVILDFQTGQRFVVVDPAHGLDCRAPRGPGGVEGDTR